MGRKIKVLGATTAYTVRDRIDQDLVILALTDNTVITLPDAGPANKGQKLEVICVAANGGAKVSISPHSSDKLYGSTYGAAGGALVALGEVLDKDAILTKATALKGDKMYLVSDGSTGWYCHGVGVWASEA